MYLIDAHQDLAYNMLSFDRDYTRSASETRAMEAGTQTPDRNGDTMLGWQEYQQGQVALVFGTLFAAPGRRAEWEQVCYHDFEQANSIYLKQVDVYLRLTGDHPDHFRLIKNQHELHTITDSWKNLPEATISTDSESGNQGLDADAEGLPITGNPVGIVMLMEGAEGIREPAELEEWWELGVRIIGPAWGGNRFCGGTNQPGPLTNEGYALLEGMASVGFCLDISHMDEKSALQALEAYPGVIIASHSNIWRLIKDDTNRHLTDAVIHTLIERDGVTGIVPMNPFLKAGWRLGDKRSEVSLMDVIAQIDTVCQIAGDSMHVGLGTDFDGGWGVQAAPQDLDTIADLRKLEPLLQEKGYQEEDIGNIFSQNWYRIIANVLP